MSQFLSEQWMRDVSSALSANDDVAGFATWADLTVQHVITDVPDLGTVEYWRQFADGEARVELGRHPEAQTTFTATYETAVAMNSGDLDVQAAFMQGKLQAEGEIALLMRHASELREVSEVQSSVPAEY